MGWAGTLRTRYRRERVADRCWATLRGARRPLTAQDLAERADASVTTARHLLARWEREGLVTSDGARERDSTGRLAPRRWTLVARQIGPRAPVLHGPILTGSGYAVMAA